VVFRSADPESYELPEQQRGWLSIIGAGGVVLVLAWLIVSTLDRAWLDCAGDIEAGGRFAVRTELLFFFLPLTLVVLIAAVAIPAFVMRRVGQAARTVVLAIALGSATVLTLSWAVPHPFGSYRVESADGPTPRCRMDSVPTWWPAWLPS
jgi:hypothetical protein